MHCSAVRDHGPPLFNGKRTSQAREEIRDKRQRILLCTHSASLAGALRRSFALLFLSLSFSLCCFFSSRSLVFLSIFFFFVFFLHFFKSFSLSIISRAPATWPSHGITRLLVHSERKSSSFASPRFPRSSSFLTVASCYSDASAYSDRFFLSLEPSLVFERRVHGLTAEPPEKIAVCLCPRDRASRAERLPAGSTDQRTPLVSTLPSFFCFLRVSRTKWHGSGEDALVDDFMGFTLFFIGTVRISRRYRRDKSGESA